MKPERALPIAIMAHNEEKVIAQAIRNCFSQTSPSGFLTHVIVVANACTDRTEDIVSSLTDQYPGRLILISMSEKGKTLALNALIRFINTDFFHKDSAPYVVLMDADCEFEGDTAIGCFVRHLEDNPLLAAVGATCTPDFLDSRCSKLVKNIYRANSELSEWLPENGISGMGYCIRKDVLEKLKFPELQIAEDMYISWMLDGWMLRDDTIKVIYKIPRNVHGELKRRVRQEIANMKFRDYCTELIKNNSVTSLYTSTLDAKFRWRGFSTKDVFVNMAKKGSIRTSLFILISVLIRILSKVIASLKHIILKNRPHYDYWQVER